MLTLTEVNFLKIRGRAKLERNPVTDQVFSKISDRMAWTVRFVLGEAGVVEYRTTISNKRFRQTVHVFDSAENYLSPGRPLEKFSAEALIQRQSVNVFAAQLYADEFADFMREQVTPVVQRYGMKADHVFADMRDFACACEELERCEPELLSLVGWHSTPIPLHE